MTDNNVDVMIRCVAAGVVVPRVLGLAQAAASTAITGAGLAVGAVTMQSSATVAAGLVVSESPAAGTSVDSGSVVSLVISSGAAVVSTGAGGSTAAAAMASMNLANAAIANGEATWAILPHTDIASDLAAVAAQLVASQVVTHASVSDYSVLGTLSDGTQMLLIYDPRDTLDLPGVVTPSAVVHASRTPKPQGDEPPPIPVVVLDDDGGPPSGASTAHEIAFLVNVLDWGAFNTAHQVGFANAFYGASLPSSSYEVDALAVTLDNILALGNSHPIDYLNIATHGDWNGCGEGYINCQYYWTSNQQSSYGSFIKYFNDIQAHRVGAAGILKVKSVQDAETYDFSYNIWLWFTPDFLVEHLVFNPGAYLANDSCSGQHPYIAQRLATEFAAANVGLYSGWNTRARGWDADQSDAYLLDRLLGEQLPSQTQLGTLNYSFADPNTGQVLYPSSLPLINEQTPPQRPFPLTDVIAAMSTTKRLPNPDPKEILGTLVQSTNSGTTSLVFTPLHGGGANSDLIIWGLPSISTMQVVESPTGATLTILGTFPAAAGTVQITDTSGTYPLTPTSWTTASITVSLPPGGNGSSGEVQVFDVDGVPSNPVPLTEWTGRLSWQESDLFSIANGASGNGTGSIDATLNMLFRADVHPLVQTVDATPVPQNFVFSGLMGSSRAILTAYNAAIDGANGDTTIFSLADPAPTMVSGYPLPLNPGQFNIVGNLPGYLPPTCNNGLPGPQPGPTTVFCPLIYMYPQDPGPCAGSLCPGDDPSFDAVFGWTINTAPGINFGTLVFTMDPTTYAVTVTSTPASITTDGDRFIGNGTESFSVTGSVGSPTSAPSMSTPAGIRKPASKFSPQ
jgi:hypothetical protein